MSTASLYSLSAVAGIIAGICIILGSLLTNLVKTQRGAFINFLGALIGLFGVTGVYLWQRAEAGVFGFVAYILVFIGLALIACIDYGGAFVAPNLSTEEVSDMRASPAMMAATISGLIFFLGVILFGISIILAGVFSWIPAVLFMVGFLATPLRQAYPLVTFIGSILSGSSIIWWSLSLWMMAPGS